MKKRKTYIFQLFVHYKEEVEEEEEYYYGDFYDYEYYFYEQ
jgi:hypothetical protein